MLLLGLGHLAAGILDVAHSAVCLLDCALGALSGSLLLLLLSLHHGLPLLLSFLQALPLLLFLLLLGQLFLLLSSDFLPLGLLLLQPLELFLLLGPLLPHSLMYSRSCSSNSPFLASWRALRKFPSPFLEVLEVTSSSS